jgi:hypothetical protein
MKLAKKRPSLMASQTVRCLGLGPRQVPQMDPMQVPQQQQLRPPAGLRELLQAEDPPSSTSQSWQAAVQRTLPAWAPPGEARPLGAPQMLGAGWLRLCCRAALLALLPAPAAMRQHSPQSAP